MPKFRKNPDMVIFSQALEHNHSHNPASPYHHVFPTIQRQVYDLLA